MNTLHTFGTPHLLLALALIMCQRCLAAGVDAPISTLSKPQVVIDLAKLGLIDPPPESDKSFFRDFSIEKLEARDDGVRVVYLNDEVLVAYHTAHESEERKDWRTVRRELEAFFLRAGDGKLLFKKRWFTRWRKDTSDMRESEARLIRVSDGRFLVHADAVLMLFSSTDYTQLKEKRLEPSGFGDLWGALSVPGGRYILLRHGHPSRMYATYEWLDSETLETVYRTESYDLAGIVAMQNSIVGNTNSGIQRLGWDGQSTPVCPILNCPKGGELAVLSPHSIAFLNRTAVGVVDTNRGLSWLTDIDPCAIPQVGDLRSASEGTRFAFSVSGWKGARFHGQTLGKSPVLFVYNIDRSQPLYLLELATTWYPYALSPSANQIAISNGSKLKIYLMS